MEYKGEEISFSRRKDFAILIYIIANGQPQRRETLALMFWPEYEPENARAGVRRALSSLRKEVGEAILDIQRDQVGVQPGAEIWIDTAEFEQHIHQVQVDGHIAGDDLCSSCFSALKEAVALYQGDFMAGFSLPDSPAFDDWQFFQADSLRQKLVFALESLVAWHQSQGEFDLAIEYNRRWLALDNLHEPAHRQLMLLYALAGQQAAALRQYDELVRILDEELGMKPAEESRELYLAIRTRKITSAASEALFTGMPRADEQALFVKVRAHNLPPQPTPFIGREAELAEITRLLQEAPDCRLLTILGPGGSGKTRLSIQVGEALFQQAEDLFSDGVRFVSLAPLSDFQALVGAVGQALSLSIVAGAGVEDQIIDFLRSKALLLILDNFEHLLSDDSVRFLSHILSLAPQVKLLVTSRERLNVLGEFLFSLSGLEVPDILIEEGAFSELEDYAAVRLFLQSARRVRPDFTLNASIAPAVSRICRLVQGMPLAVVLAATWVELLSPSEIESEIERSLDFLEGEWRDLPERQRSLRAVFNASWEQLEPEERQSIEALSVFRAPFSREAAQAVGQASLRVLLSLMNKSWLQKTSGGRYSIHELLRQYSQERLLKHEAAYQGVRERYCRYYGRYSVALAGELEGPGQREAAVRIREEFDNIRTAWFFLLEDGQVDAAVSDLLPALFRYVEARARAPDLWPLLEAAEQVCDWKPGGETKEKTRSRFVLRTARAAFLRNAVPVRLETFGMVVPIHTQELHQAWDLAQQIEDLPALGFWGPTLAYVYGRFVDRETGLKKLRDLRSAFEMSGQSWNLGLCYQFLAQLLQLEWRAAGDIDEAEQSLEAALEIFRRLGDERESGYTLRALGQQNYRTRRLPEGISYWQAAQEKLEPVGEWVVAADIHWQIGDAYLQLGEPEKAFKSYRRRAEIYLVHGHKRGAASALSKESYEALRYGDIEQARETRQRSLDLAIDVGDSYAEAWGYWELGEIERVAGNPAGARRNYETAREKFTGYEDSTGQAFYCRALGDLALFERNFTAAAEHFTTSAEIARSNDHSWALAYALSGRGLAYQGLGNREGAQADLKEALQHAQALQERGVTLVVIDRIAQFYADEGMPERAVQLSAVVANHPVSWRETREKAEDRLVGMATALPAERFFAAQQEGVNLDLWRIELHEA